MTKPVAVRTQDLIARLSRNVPPVPRDAVTRRLRLAMTWGLAGDVIVLLMLFGFDSDMPEQLLSSMFWVRVAFPFLTIVAGMQLAARLSRPGAALRRAWLETLIPVAAMLAVAVGLLIATPREYRLQFMLGGQAWWESTGRLALLSLPSLAATLYAMKGLAPTRLVLAGTGAGVLAGAQGLLVYALYCSDAAVEFWRVRDVLAIAVVAAIGAILAPRYARW